MFLNLEGISCFIVSYLSLFLNLLLQTPVKPPMKEPTEPIDLVLHSDVRAVGRAKFDHQVSCPLRCSLAVEEFMRAMHRLSSMLQVTERIIFMEEVKLERERQRKVYYHHLSESYGIRFVFVQMQELITWHNVFFCRWTRRSRSSSWGRSRCTEHIQCQILAGHLSQKGIEVPFVSSNDLITTFCTVNHWISQSQLPEVLNMNWNKRFMHISIPASTQLLVSNYSAETFGESAGQWSLGQFPGSQDFNPDWWGTPPRHNHLQKVVVIVTVIVAILSV